MDGLSGWKTRLNRLRREGESGQALVETCLTLPILLIMLVGAGELCQVAYAAIEVSNAAKAGIQYAAMNGGGYTDPSNGVAEATHYDALNIYQPNPSNFTTSTSMSCACSSSTDTVSTCSTTAGATGCTSSHMYITVTVNTTEAISPLLSLPWLPSTFTLRGSATQLVLQ